MLKKIIVHTVLLFIITVAHKVAAADIDDFVITVNTANVGVSSMLQFQIPTKNTGYNYNVDCNNDGNNEANSLTGNYICNYATAGIYTIRIKDNSGIATGFPRIYFNDSGDKQKLLTIEQWGTGVWTSMSEAFMGAIFLTVPASDVPNLSGVNSLQHMFRGASMANPDTEFWITSSILKMQGMFYQATTANPNISNWNTSNVNSMANMFFQAFSANPDASLWNVSNVTSMANMFTGVTLSPDNYDAMLINFNAQNLNDSVSFHAGNSVYCQAPAQSARANMIANDNWNITDGGVCDPNDDFVITVNTSISSESMATEFIVQTTGSGYNYNIDCNNDGIHEANNLTGIYVCDYTPLGGAGIYTIRIKNNSINGTGFPRVYFNNEGDKNKIISLNQWGIGSWTSMQRAFYGTANMTVPATDVPNFSAVQNMVEMFHNAFLANPVTTNWDVSNVTNMSNMFNSATSASPNTHFWNTEKVTNMRVMFQNAILANPDTASWDTSEVTKMDYMFNGASVANPDTSSWNTELVTNMSHMFANAVSANPNTNNWDVSMVEDMTNMFIGVTIPTVDYDDLLVAFDAQSLQNGVDFHGGNSLYCRVAAQIARANMMSSDNWSITDAGICPTSDPNNDFVITVNSTHTGSSSSTEFTIPTVGGGYDYNVDCNNDGINEATDITGNYTCDFSSLGGEGVYTIRIKDNTGVGTGFHRIYLNASGDSGKLLTIEQWGTGLWSSMNRAFFGASRLTVPAIDVPNFSNVTNMRRMFQFAVKANPDTTDWNTANVIDMSLMFSGALLANPNTSNWETKKVETMQAMFVSATMANPDTSTWDISSVVDMSNMFLNVTLPSANYDAMLIGFNKQIIQSGVNFHGGNSIYCSPDAQISRDKLINIHSWLITDAGQCNGTNIAPTFNVTCDLDATDVTGGSTNTMQIPNFIYNTVVGPFNELSQTYTLSLAIANAGDPDGLISAMSLNNNGDISLEVNINNSGVVTLDVTMQDSGGSNMGGQDTTVVQFNLHNYADLNLDPDLPINDILYKNTFDPCR